MPSIADALDRTEFDALNICRTREGEWLPEHLLAQVGDPEAH